MARSLVAASGALNIRPVSSEHRAFDMEAN
jgi:hypothetical protein